MKEKETYKQLLLQQIKEQKKFIISGLIEGNIPDFDTCNMLLDKITAYNNLELDDNSKLITADSIVHIIKESKTDETFKIVADMTQRNSIKRFAFMDKYWIGEAKALAVIGEFIGTECEYRKGHINPFSQQYCTDSTEMIKIVGYTKINPNPRLGNSYVKVGGNYHG